jgi:hypothetical protein
MNPDPDLDPDPAFLRLLFEGTFTSFLKDKNPKEVTKQKDPKVFLNIFA